MELRVGDYRIDPLRRSVMSLTGGESLPLGGREFDVLWTLVQHTGAPVTTADLLEEVWKDANVEKNNLAKAVAQLRKKLGRDYIVTTPGGYQLAAVVKSLGPAESAAAAPANPASPPAVPRRRFRGRIWIGAALFLAATAGPAWVILERPAPLHAVPPFGRVLVHATSENSHQRRIALSHPAQRLALSPSGETLFAVGDTVRSLSVVDIASGRVTETPLPAFAGNLAPTRDGRVYLGGAADGLMIWDKRAPTGIQTVSTGGRVLDLVFTPDETKLYLAMSYSGLKRYSPRTGELVQFSDRICPVLLDMERSGSRLYVSYQCGGPSGATGRDEIEIIDIAREAPIGVLSANPLVGGHVSVSPDGALAIVDGSDVCTAPQYSHEACPIVPGSLAHLFRILDRRLLHTFAYPVPVIQPVFLDSSRILLSGMGLRVVSAKTYQALEHLQGATGSFAAPVISPDGRRLYTARAGENAITIIDLEDASCGAPGGLTALFPGDGAWDDAAGISAAEPHGTVGFAPGKVGQAFDLKGDGSTLVANNTGYDDFGPLDGAIAFYVKFRRIAGERPLIYRKRAENAGYRIYKDRDNRIVADVTLPDGGPLSLRGSQPVPANAWQHIVLSHSSRTLALYVNGEVAASATLPGVELAPGDHTVPLYLGSAPGGHVTLDGLIDEVALFSRGLSSDEVKRLYGMREAGPCKP